MRAYIKSNTSFRTIWQRPTLDYELCLDSEDAEKSSVTLAGDDIPASCCGDWLIVNGTVYLITAVSASDGKTKVSLAMPEDAFTRPRIYTAPSGPVALGAWIASELNAGWRDEEDAVYAMPYLQVSSNDEATPFVAPELDDNGMYVMTDYLRSVRKSHHLRPVFSTDGDELRVVMTRYAPGKASLVADDGHTSVKTASFSGSATAKVTTIQPVDTGEVDENGEKIFTLSYVDWYLAKDGSFSSTPPQDRADGVWATVTVSEKADPAERVASIFAGNVESRKLELWHDQLLQVHDKIVVRLGSGVYEDTVGSVWRKCYERRWLIKAGLRATTLSEKVRVAGSSGSSRAGTAAAEIPVGSLFFTVLPGDPADLLGYGAWDRIQGRFLYAADASHPVHDRGGAASHTISKEELPSLTLPLKYNGEKQLVMTASAASGSARTVPQLTNGEGNLAVHLDGQGKSFSLLPPYWAVYVWLRKE